MLRRLHGQSEIFFGISQNNWSFIGCIFIKLSKEKENQLLPPRTLSFERKRSHQPGWSWEGGSGSWERGSFWASFGQLACATGVCFASFAGATRVCLEELACAARVCLEEPLEISFWNLLSRLCPSWFWTELQWFFYRVEGFEPFCFSFQLCFNLCPLLPFLGLCAFLEEHVHLSWKYFLLGKGSKLCFGPSRTRFSQKVCINPLMEKQGTPLCPFIH